MSTKIYNAYKYEGDIQSLIAIFVKEKNEVHKRFISNIPESFLFRLWNKTPINKKNKNNLINYDALKEIEKHFRQVTFDCASSFSEDVSIMVYFPKKEFFEKETYLFQVFGGIGMQYLDLTKYPEIKDFHYQNQSDQPEEISEDEWDFREEVWDDIFNENFKPTEVGLLFEMIGIIHSTSLAWSLLDSFKEYCNAKIKNKK